jgi:hypothetical protein
MSNDSSREPIMKFFERDRAHSIEEGFVIRHFSELAEYVHALPRNAERSTALRKLLEAQDAAIRAVMP